MKKKKKKKGFISFANVVYKNKGFFRGKMRKPEFMAGSDNENRPEFWALLFLPCLRTALHVLIDLNEGPPSLVS